jgi:periplasmic protein TonB
MNLNSKAWCDIIFEGRNKQYGAYMMRRKSAKRHVLAFLIVLAFLALVVGIPILIDNILYNDYQLENSEAIVSEYQLLDAIQEEDLQPGKQVPALPIPSDATQTNATSTQEIQTVKPDRPDIVKSELQEEDPYLEELQKEDVQKKETKKDTEAPVDNQLYTIVEEMPSFPGGEQGLMEYLSKNLRYPFTALDKKIENIVICIFFIEKDGSINQAEVIQSVNPLLDKEALRVIRTLPRWKPARQHGKPIRVKYILPVSFRLK